MVKNGQSSLKSALRTLFCLSAKPVERFENSSETQKPGFLSLVAQEDISSGLHVHVVDHVGSGVASRYPSWIGCVPEMPQSASSMGTVDMEQHCRATKTPGPDNQPPRVGRVSLRPQSDSNTVAGRTISGPEEGAAPQPDPAFKKLSPNSPCAATSQISMASVTSCSDVAAQYGFQAAPWEHRSAHSFTYNEDENGADKGSSFRQQSGFQVGAGSMGDLYNLSQRSTTSSSGSSRALQPGLLSAKLRQSASGSSRASGGSQDLLWHGANSRQGRQGKYATWQQRRWWQQFQQPLQAQQLQQLQQQLQQQQQGRLPTTIDEDRSLRGVRDYLYGAAACAPERPLTPRFSAASPSASPAAGPAAHPSEPPLVPMVQTYGFCTGEQEVISPAADVEALLLTGPLQLQRRRLPQPPALSPHLLDFDPPPAHRHQQPRHRHTSDVVIHKLRSSDAMSGEALLPNAKVSVGSTLETRINTLS